MVNVPLAAGSDGLAARRAAEEQWLPALKQFAPQMIFISAGFDAHRDDLLGGMRLVESDFVWMTRQIMSVAEQHADSRVVSLLEGGYELGALGRSAVAHVRALAAL
jgi:acetoin utilization deacetylase AcuC-like enzyme